MQRLRVKQIDGLEQRLKVRPSPFEAFSHSRTSYSKATPSGAFSMNHASAATVVAKTLMCSGVSDLLGGVVDPDRGHHFRQKSLNRSGDSSV